MREEASEALTMLIMLHSCWRAWVSTPAATHTGSKADGASSALSVTWLMMYPLAP